MAADQRWRINLGDLKKPASPLYKIHELSAELRNPIKLYLTGSKQGILLPEQWDTAGHREWSMWIRGGPSHGVLIALCADPPKPSGPDRHQQPWHYFIEATIPRYNVYRVARATDFFHEDKLKERYAQLLSNA